MPSARMVSPKAKIWFVTSISHKVKGVEIFFFVETKSHDLKNNKEIRNDISLILKLDEDNVQSVNESLN